MWGNGEIGTCMIEVCDGVYFIFFLIETYCLFKNILLFKICHHIPSIAN